MRYLQKANYVNPAQMLLPPRDTKITRMEGQQSCADGNFDTSIALNLHMCTQNGIKLINKLYFFIQMNRKGVRSVTCPFSSSLQESQVYLVLHLSEEETQQSITIIKDARVVSLPLAFRYFGDSLKTRTSRK